LRVAQVAKAMVNVGAILAGKVTGRVSTELDPRLADDAGKKTTLPCRDAWQEPWVAWLGWLFEGWSNRSGHHHNALSPLVAALVAKAKQLAGLYKDMDVPLDKLLFR